MSNLLQKFHNLIVKYGLCSSEDAKTGIDIFVLISRAVIMSEIQNNNYLDPNDKTNRIGTMGNGLISLWDENGLPNADAWFNHFVELVKKYTKGRDAEYLQEVFNNICTFNESYEIKNLIEIVDVVKKIFDSDSDLQNLNDQFTDKYTSKSSIKEKQTIKTETVNITTTAIASNSQWTPQNVCDLTAKISLKYLKLLKLDQKDNSEYNTNEKAEETEETETDDSDDNDSDDNENHEYEETIKHLKGIRVIDAGSGNNALTNAIIDNSIEQNIQISYLRGYEFNIKFQQSGDILLMRKLYKLQKNKKINCSFINDLAEDADNDVTMPNDITMKIELWDYLKMSELMEKVDLTISNPPYGDYDKNNTDPCLKFINVAVQNSIVSVFIVPKNCLIDKKGTERKTLIDNILNKTEIVEVIDLGPSQKIFNKGVSDIVILVLIQKEYINQLMEAEGNKINYAEQYKYFNFSNYSDCCDLVRHHNITNWNTLGNKIVGNIITESTKPIKMTEETNTKTKHLTGIFEYKTKQPGLILTKEQPNLLNVLRQKLEEKYLLENIKKAICPTKPSYLIDDFDEDLNQRNKIIDDMFDNSNDDPNDLIPSRFLNVLSNGEHLDPRRLQLVKLSEWFEIVDKCKSHYTNECVENGKYPLIGAAKTNNGVVGYLNTYDFENTFTIVKDGDGAAGYVFYHNYKFNKVPTVYIINKCKDFENINLNTTLISIQLNQIYNHENKINKDNFKTIECYMYI